MIRLKFKKFLPFIISLSVFLITLAICSLNDTTSTIINSNIELIDTENSSTTDTVKSSEEMRGIWISYIELSMENEVDKSKKRFTKKFEQMAENCKNFGFNTLIVQVRPFCDALYKSEIYPWSHILTGNQGENPNYDPLEIMCRICNEKGLYLHAWINPYRISMIETPQTLSNNNPYKLNNEIGIKTDSTVILDPSSEKARELIIKGIEEIIKNYDVDGIQFDDYFYPEDINNSDEAQYQNYINTVGENNSMSLDSWRKANVNMLICETYRKIHSLSDNVVFGVSPQGNINNNKNLYADVISWCTCRGFVDYICPQIYFSIENPALTFEDSLSTWTELEFDKDVKLYVGLGGYKAGSDADDGTWLISESILSDEYEILKSNNKVSGFMLYSYASLNTEQTIAEMSNLKEKLN